MNIHVQQYLLQRQIHLEGRTYIIADGDCMTPLIDDKDKLVIIAPTQIKKGNILLVACSDKLRVHRLIELDGDRVLTKGDLAYNLDEEIIHKSQIVGIAKYNYSKKHMVSIPFIDKQIAMWSLLEHKMVEKKGWESKCVHNLQRIIRCLLSLTCVICKHCCKNREM